MCYQASLLVSGKKIDLVSKAKYKTDLLLILIIMWECKDGFNIIKLIASKSSWDV